MTILTNNTGTKPLNTNISSSINNGWEFCPDFETDSKYNEKLTRLQKEAESKLFDRPKRTKDGRLDTSIVDDLGKPPQMRKDYPGQIADYAVIRCIFQSLQSTNSTRRKLAEEYARRLTQSLNKNSTNYALVLLKYYCTNYIIKLVKNENSMNIDQNRLPVILADVPLPILRIARFYCLSEISQAIRGRLHKNAMHELLHKCMSDVLQKKRLKQMDPVYQGDTRSTGNDMRHDNRPQRLIIPFPPTNNQPTVSQPTDLQDIDRPQKFDFGLVKSRLFLTQSYHRLNEALHYEFFEKEKDIDKTRVKTIGKEPENLESDFLILECILKEYGSSNKENALRACEYLRMMFEDRRQHSFMRKTLPFLTDYFSWRIDEMLKPSGKLNSDFEPECLSERLASWTNCDMWCATHLANDRIRQLNSPQRNVFEMHNEFLELPQRRSNGVVRLTELVALIDNREIELRQSLENQKEFRQPQIVNPESSFSENDILQQLIRQLDNNNNNHPQYGRRRILEHSVTSQSTKRQRMITNDLNINLGSFFDLASDDERSFPTDSHIPSKKKPIDKDKKDNVLDLPENKRND